MKFIKTTCAYCNKSFLRSIRQSNEAIKFSWRQFCSKDCLIKNKTTGKILYCFNPSCYKSFFRKLGEIKKSNKHYCSNSCAATVSNRHRAILKCCELNGCKILISKCKKYCSSEHSKASRKIPDEQYRYQIIQKIKLFYEKNNRIPVKREMGGIYKISRALFGTWNKAVEAAGFISNPVLFSHRHMADDGHMCDSLAEKIIDNWLHKRNIDHQRNVSYPNSAYNADFLVKNSLIEFFGLSGELKKYDIAVKAKENLVKQYHLKLIKIYPKDIFPTNKLGDILRDFL